MCEIGDVRRYSTRCVVYERCGRCEMGKGVKSRCVRDAGGLTRARGPTLRAPSYIGGDAGDGGGDGGGGDGKGVPAAGSGRASAASRRCTSYFPWGSGGMLSIAAIVPCDLSGSGPSARGAGGRWRGEGALVCGLTLLAELDLKAVTNKH
jgi:hypothetical protein